MNELLALICRGVGKQFGRCTPLLGAIAFLMLPSGPVQAYELDSHYYLRFGLSLSTCFDWDEAHLIASGDWNMDANGSTHAEMNPVQKSNKINWHAFGHSDKRFRELWLRSVAEEDLELRLIKLGQFMHFLEDWESHAGYGIRIGHARDTYRGRDEERVVRADHGSLRRCAFDITPDQVAPRDRARLSAQCRSASPRHQWPTSPLP